MKICLIVRHLSAKAGGIAVYTRNLIRALEREGHAIELSPEERFSYLLWQFLRVPLWLVRSKCDVYHAVGIIEGITLPLFRRRAEKRITIHDIIPLKHPRKGFKGLFERFFIRLGLISARKCDVIYAVSHLTKVDLVRLAGIPENKIKVVHQPIDERFFREPLGEGKFREPGKFMLGYISRMDYHKRHALLVELFKCWDNPNARLLLAGAGEEFERVRKLAEGDPRIRLLGFVPDEELVEFYDSLDVYVHTSKYEGWGLPIAEALGRGKPVIVFEDAEIPREVKDLCVTASNNSFSDIVEGLFWNRKLLRKLSNRRCLG
ncbi:glycosyltransferase family 4 protein [Thermococcus radiotolerans]|uniref:Glycosyl transferase n=1 Tax=Thermococcus radiotolerans TaxID=187880 RepID=A0A2Z2MZI3_9EURY|nr:glycosyltransferase family 4 protein [Thermococcus radiotolerans]ASJ15225.1 glycosyl transferase [Thermococcus radiotolerans]